MPRISRVTPNLVVSNVEESIAFYRDVLDFSLVITVPEQSPFVFAAIQSGPVDIFLNAPEPSYAEYPSLKDRPLGGTFTIFLEVDDISGVYDSLKDRVTLVMPFEKKWYGVTEFAIADPDGYLITFAQHTP